jgi:hypothetical protein
MVQEVGCVVSDEIVLEEPLPNTPSAVEVVFSIVEEVLIYDESVIALPIPTKPRVELVFKGKYGPGKVLSVLYEDADVLTGSATSEVAFDGIAYGEELLESPTPGDEAGTTTEMLLTSVGSGTDVEFCME